MGLKDLSISMVLIMLFVISIIFFGVGLAVDNQAQRSILDDDIISNLRTNISSTSNNYKADVDSGIQAYTNSTAVVGGDTPQKATEESLFGSIYSVPRQAFDITMEFIFVRLFGGSEEFRIIFVIISSFIAVLFLAYVVKAIRSGDV